ncbi:MAG: peptide chain release factor N(5)-glutamine methyltransferase [Tagaea sp.]|nr:peptide chain release factor N(5)-glutamine methyltransferase [Tagaea sp.]
MSGLPSIAIGDLLAETRAALAEAGVGNPRLDARLIVGAAAGATIEQMIARPETPVDADSAAFARALAERRADGAPIAYLLGAKEFWSLDFAVTAATLVPRPDSETLVEAALARCADWSRAWRVADLGTGSGCLLLAFLSERPHATGVGLDASIDALSVARANAHAHWFDARARFVCGSWTAALAGPFDLIFANPPYIPSDDIPLLAREVRDYEPYEALHGGADGLDHYRAILADLPRILAPGGAVVFEVGQGQALPVADLCELADLKVEAIRRDLGGISRCVVAAKSSA